MRSSSLLHVVAVATVAVACGDEPPAGPPAAPLTIWVFDEALAIGGDDTPLAGTTVAFDPPGGGERVVRTTEGDGHVTFEADFAKGGAQVSAVSIGHTLVTMLDVSPETARARPNTFGKPASDLVIVLPRLDQQIRRETVELRGTISGKRDPSNHLDVAASAVRRLGSDVTSGPAYSLRAPRARPFFVIGHESEAPVESGDGVTSAHVGIFRLDVAARDADGSLDLDLGRIPPLPARTVRLRVDAPRGAGSPFVAGTRASAVVSSADSELLVGAFARSAPTADGAAYDLETVVTDVDIAPERAVTRATVRAPDGSLSRRAELGVVADGTVWSDLLAPPSVPEASRSLADPIPLDGWPEGADLRAEVFAGGQLVWILRGPPGGPRQREIAFPAPVGLGLSADVQLLAVTIAAEADRVLLPPHTDLYRRVAVSRDIVLRVR